MAVAADGGSRSAGSCRPGYEVVAERIPQLIAESEPPPGDRMPAEKELAERLATSRSVVREAVKILSTIGRVRAHKGLFLSARPRPRVHAVRVPPHPEDHGEQPRGT